eukprot:m.452511 g.452511  ORF g.452511 m.452511 type:complete len:448 (-) comp20325_c5_seq12:18-1361(-)
MAATGTFHSLYALDVHNPAALLGQGAFGKVYQCSCKRTKQQYAVKVISSDKLTHHVKEKVSNEVKVCLKLGKHRHIVALHAVFEEVEGTLLLLDLVAGGELFDEIVTRTNYSLKAASACMQQVLNGIKHCHDRGVIHRDIKPENLLLSHKKPDARIKLADFGLAVICDKPHRYGICGTPGYLAPEVLCNQEYDCKVDMWACGVLLYILLCGYPPFPMDEPFSKMRQRLTREAFVFDGEEWESVGNCAKDLIRCLLVADASKRFDAEQALNHDFIANGGGPCTSVAQLSRKRTLVMLRKFNARRKFKGAIRAVIGGLRLRSSSSWTRAAPDEEHFVLQRAGTKRRRVDEQAPAAVSASALQLKLWFRLGATATRVSITLGECELVDDLRPLVVKRFAAIGSPVPGPFALLWNEGELAADVLVSTVWPSRQGELGPGGSVDTAVVVSPL